MNFGDMSLMNIRDVDQSTLMTNAQPSKKLATQKSGNESVVPALSQVRLFKATLPKSSQLLAPTWVFLMPSPHTTQWKPMSKIQLRLIVNCLSGNQLVDGAALLVTTKHVT